VVENQYLPSAQPQHAVLDLENGTGGVAVAVVMTA
jgi:hypothetical protein